MLYNCILVQGGSGPDEPGWCRELGRRPQPIYGGSNGEGERGEVLSQAVLGPTPRLWSIPLCCERVRWKEKPRAFYSCHAHPEI